MKQTIYTKRDISILLKVPIETVEECIKKIYGKIYKQLKQNNPCPIFHITKQGK